MLLSVIVPVFNTQNFLRDCLDSLTAQGLCETEYEIICVNDGSTDNSLQILQDYAQRYTNIRIVDQANKGVAAARNAGLRAAQGKYTAFCDSDDVLRTGSLGMIISFMEEKALQALVMSAFQTVQKDFHYTEETTPQPDITILPHSMSSARNVCSMIVETALWRDNGIAFCDGMQYGEDTLFAGKVFSFAALQKAKIGILCTSVYYYRMRQGSAMHNLNRDKHFADMHTMALEYAKIADRCRAAPPLFEILQKRIGAAVSAMLYDNLKSRAYTPEALFQMLKDEGLYPFHTQWWAVKEAKSFKLRLVNLWKYTFHNKILYRLYFAVLCKIRKS